jgi:hypothetical protein
MKLRCRFPREIPWMLPQVCHSNCHFSPIKIPSGCLLRTVFRHSTYPVLSVEIAPQSQTLSPPLPHQPLCIFSDEK